MSDVSVERSAQAATMKSGTQRKRSSKAQRNFAAELLDFEGEVRSIKDERELNYHLCNSSRRVISFQQCFYGKVSKTGSFTLLNSSSVSIVDRNSLFSRWIEKIVQRLINDVNVRQACFSLPMYCDEIDEEKDTYPFVEFLWTPQVHNDQIVSGTLMTRETPWGEPDCALATRLSELYFHAKAALKGQKSLAPSRVTLKPALLSACALTVMLGFLPVSITALAPVEVVPKQPFVLAAPFDGVIREITAPQGKELNQGDTVVIFDDVHLLNESKLAAQRTAIADARYQRASQGAIADYQVKREIEVARAEYELALAESQYAAELLAQARLTSPVPGIAIYTDKSDWEGKPVAAGEAIVAIADPAKVEMEINLPVKDSIVLSEGARVKIFLDSDPLNPLDATLTKASYRAQPDKRDILSYTLTAELSEADAELPRIGVQGTAQVFSDKASLAYVVFRRPITAFRQYTGW